MDLKQKLSKNLRHFKEANRRSLTDFAEDLDVSRTTIQKMLDGKSNTNLETIERICEKLSIEPEILLSDSGTSFYRGMEAVDAIFLTLAGLPELKRNEFIGMYMKLLQLLSTEESNKTGWKYKAVAEEGYDPDIGEFSTYAIRSAGGDIVHNVTTNRREIERMAWMFTEYDLAPEHMTDAILDFIG